MAKPQRPRNDHSRGSAELATHGDFLMSAETQEPGTMNSQGQQWARSVKCRFRCKSRLLLAANTDSVFAPHLRGLAMMGRLNCDQSQLFYEFHLDEVVPADHLVRHIDAVLDLSWVHAELAPHYPSIGRPSIDPVLMIRMLIVGYVFAIRSE